MRGCWLALPWLALAACRSGGERVDAPPEPVAGSELAGSDLSGYDRDGAISCPALPAGRQCLVTEAATAAKAACSRAGGTPLVCEDCSVLCSKRP